MWGMFPRNGVRATIDYGCCRCPTARAATRSRWRTEATARKRRPVTPSLPDPMVHSRVYCSCVLCTVFIARFSPVRLLFDFNNLRR